MGRNNSVNEGADINLLCNSVALFREDIQNATLFTLNCTFTLSAWARATPGKWPVNNKYRISSIEPPGGSLIISHQKGGLLEGKNKKKNDNLEHMNICVKDTVTKNNCLP